MLVQMVDAGEIDARIDDAAGSVTFGAAAAAAARAAAASPAAAAAAAAAREAATVAALHDAIHASAALSRRMHALGQEMSLCSRRLLQHRLRQQNAAISAGQGAGIAAGAAGGAGEGVAAGRGGPVCPGVPASLGVGEGPPRGDGATTRTVWPLPWPAPVPKMSPA